MTLLTGSRIVIYASNTPKIIRGDGQDGSNSWRLDGGLRSFFGVAAAATGLTDFERDLFTTNGGRIDEEALRRFRGRRS